MNYPDTHTQWNCWDGSAGARTVLRFFFESHNAPLLYYCFCASYLGPFHRMPRVKEEKEGHKGKLKRKDRRNKGIERKKKSRSKKERSRQTENENEG